ncbi:hypothetical protein OS493_001684, partial [Desmophyllum pertusum]
AMDTADYGWPISAPIKRVDTKIYVEARKGLTPYGYFNEKQCKKGAYKQIEELLKQYGLKETEIYVDKNCKNFISAEAFILTVIAGTKLRDPAKNAEQFFLGEIGDTSVTTTTIASGTPTTMVETISMQNSCTAAPEPKVFTGCIKPPESTSTLAGRLAEGTNIDFLHGISLSVGRRFKQQHNSDSDWQGQLEKQDIILLTKLTQTKAGVCLYNEIAAEQATVQIPASTILKLQDQCNSGQTIDEMRRILPPGYLTSKKKVAQLKNKYKLEFEAIMQPQRTPTGYRIEPCRLVECLQFLYYWLPKEQWWHLYGDGRKYGKKDTVLMAISNVNNEQKLNGVKFQSPKEMWPVHIFHHKDSRRNLELNIGDGHGGPGYLNEWIEESQNLGHQVFLGGDSKFLDAIADPDLSPLSKDKWNLWMQCSASEKDQVHPSTGLRTDLNLSFDRPLPRSLLPALTGNHILMCIDHGFTRVAENLIMKVVRTCLDLESRYGKERKNAALAHLAENINARDVLPSCQLQEMLSPKLMEALERMSQNINDIDCVKLIWWHFYQMYRILRKDVAQLKPGHPVGSTNIEDYEFGIQDAEIARYVYHANIFHSLMVFRYGCKELTPYMMKFVDVVPKHLRSTPFKSLMRVATEGGERTHYMHICFYYQHSTRDGGLHKPDTILMLLSWSYRNLRERINDCPEQIRTDFESYAQRHLAAYTIQKWWKIVHSRPAAEPRETEVRHVLPLKKMDFVLVGRMPEEEVKRDCSKLNSDLVMAYRRGWTVVKPSFIEWAVKEKTPPNLEEHAVDLAPLAASSAGACGAMQQSLEQLRFSKEISGFAALKRTIREVERSPANQNGNKSQKRDHKKKKDAMVSPQKPPNGWTAFLNENLKERVQNNQIPGRTERITFLKSIQNMAEEWRQLSVHEKRDYKQKAIELHLKRKQERHQIREETKENRRREQLREKAYESLAIMRN